MGKPYWDLEKRLQSAKNLWTLKKKEVLVRKETSGEPFKSQCKQVRLDAFDHLSLPTNCLLYQNFLFNVNIIHDFCGSYPQVDQVTRSSYWAGNQEIRPSRNCAGSQHCSQVKQIKMLMFKIILSYLERNSNSQTLCTRRAQRSSGQSEAQLLPYSLQTYVFWMFLNFKKFL